MLSLLLTAALLIPESSLHTAFAGHEGAFVMTDCSSWQTFHSDAAACAQKHAPCSTFKIWNTAIGLETGKIEEADALFWKWDGVKRSFEGWNQDQTLRSAFTVSCVPAYQALARSIGKESMQQWIDKIAYGDKNISSGVDVFWLPAPDRTSILISPDEQAQLLCKLVTGKMPFSAKTLALLKEVMTAKTTPHGTLYGKTGSGTDGQGNFIQGWYVGYVESAGKTYAFACYLTGQGVTGKDARACVENILTGQKLL